MRMTKFPLSDEEILEISKLVDSQESIPLIILLQDAFMMTTLLQLTSRNSDLPQGFLEFAERMGHYFQTAVTALHPETEKLLELGWHPTNYEEDDSED